MRRIKLELLSISTSILTMMAIAIILPHNSYSDNAVEVKESAVVYENQTLDHRGLDNKYHMSSINLNYIQEIHNTITVKSEKINKVTYNWTTEKVNFRTEPNTDSNIIETLDKRVKVKVISKSDKWIEVKHDSKVGWIYSKYLRDTELPSLNFTDKEIDLLAKIVWLESRSQSDEGEAAVVIVVINRILSEEFPDTMYEVLSEENQFTSWKLINTAKPTEREYEIIEEVLNGEWNILNKGYFYFSTTARNNNGTIKIGQHYFCKLDKD